jgi:hypothetical protein
MKNDLGAVVKDFIHVIDVSVNSSSDFNMTKIRFVEGLVNDI